MRYSTLSLIAGLAMFAGLAQPALAGDTLRVALAQEPTALDPTSDATASIDTMITNNVLESLTTVDSSGAVQPNLATRWDISDDGLTYRFHLVADVTFHDGTTFDADDVKFTFDRAMAKDSTNPSPSIFEPIDSVTVIDQNTVEIKLKRKDAFFLFNIANGDASIVAPESVGSLSTTPIGTGPFTLASWTRGDRLVLRKNPDYRDAQDVALDRVEYRFIADAAATAAALMAEEVDVASPPPEMLPQFEADPRFAVSVGTTEGEVILAMNNSRAPFTDARVRQAVNHAIDRQAIIDGAMYGRAVPIGSFYPPHGPAYVDLTGRWPHDTGKAKALLAEANAQGTTMTISVPPFPYATRSAEIIRAELEAVGIDAKMKVVEWSYWIDEIYKKRNYDMTIIAHTSPNDMGNFARGPDYFYGYQSDEFDAIWEAIRTQADPDARNALLAKAQTYLADNAVMGFLFQLPKITVARAGVEGLWKNAPVIFAPMKGVHWAH